MTMMRVTKACL